MHDAHLRPRPLGGRILTVPVAILTVLTLVGFYYIAKRYYFGIGAVANVNPGYPWGIWVAFDVIVGPGLTTVIGHRRLQRLATHHRTVHLFRR